MNTQLLSGGESCAGTRRPAVHCLGGFVLSLVACPRHIDAPFSNLSSTCPCIESELGTLRIHLPPCECQLWRRVGMFCDPVCASIALRPQLMCSPHAVLPITWSTRNKRASIWMYQITSVGPQLSQQYVVHVLRYTCSSSCPRATFRRA